MDTGKVIREIRSSLNWTRPKLSKEAEVALQTIVNVEYNKDCKVSTLEKLLKPMGYYIEIKRIQWP